MADEPAKASTTIAAAPPPVPQAKSAAERIEALFARTFPGSRLGFDTELWNLVRTFTDEVKSLL